MDNGGPAYLRFRKTETNLLRKADSVICISETLKSEAISRGVSPGKITVSPNGFDNTDIEKFADSEQDFFKSVKTRLDSSKGAKIVGYIGSLRTLEGVDFSAKAVADLIKKGYNLKFFVLPMEEEAGVIR